MDKHKVLCEIRRKFTLIYKVSFALLLSFTANGNPMISSNPLESSKWLFVQKLYARYILGKANFIWQASKFCLN